MEPSHAIGMFLIGLGLGIFFLLARLWSHTKRDPLWILRGELQELRRELRPEVLQVVNAVLVAFGALAGAGALGIGLFLLRRF